VDEHDAPALARAASLDFELDGVVWAVKLSRNDTVAVTTTRTTRAPSGSFQHRAQARQRPRARHDPRAGHEPRRRGMHSERDDLSR